MAQLELRQVKKRYGDHDVIHGIDMQIGDGEFVVIVGPSGCGKSTLLRMVAGLEDITGGEVAIDGRVVNNLEPKDRDIAMVFQNYALYPHMSVFDNMAYGLKIRGMSKRRDRTARGQGGKDPGTGRVAAKEAPAALRRAAATRGDGPRDRARTQGVPVRRAVVQSRRQAAGADAAGNPEAAPRVAHHQSLRDP